MIRDKKAVLVLARESSWTANASYLLEGLVTRLLGSSYLSQLLKEMFVFYVVPMLNVEGVVLGNSHANVSGQYVHANYRGHEPYCPESNAV